MIHLTRKIDYACPRCGETRLEACSVLCLSNTFAIGGISGFHSGGYQVTGTKNYGPVQADVAAIGIGGLLGHIGNAAHTTGTGCAVNCTLTSAASTEIGMVIGAFNGKTKAIVLGTAADPIEVMGTVNGTVLDAGTYTNYLWGPALSDPGFHTIHTVYGE